MQKLSIVIPAYQDEASIEQNFSVIKQELDRWAAVFSYEIILVNDGSRDNTILALDKIQREFPMSVGVVNLTRNFGQVAAIYAGLERCNGDCAAVISSDLQDPPELIREMFAEWQAGAETVIAVRKSREDSRLSATASKWFYGLMQRFALAEIPEGGFDFFLLDRTVINRVLESRERNGFLQGQILLASGRIARIAYARRARAIGRSGWSFLRKMKYSVDGFAAYSFTPIRFIAALGLLVFLCAVLLSGALVIQRIFFGTAAPGWSSVMIAILLLHGLEFLAIGIVGEYVWRTLDQVRPRPLFLIDYFKPPQAEAGI